ncbi:hypothetical protein [Singulisphaera acidiphila]|uniref:Uncharacterized protein n=1 Tax=Singulisphaera acidiphila (strain ATCC BAA-1392 / DSM 18658 / VKM B-2454 / MOB10) TaxID=886293 RepID=L0DF61_SINAD|nr:hypothetical protein [Singulisphaera acidiphila]AGA27490.1 hypothetical protein Sinac_3217 [Singulisphaera acidiphila DSM 18658]
MTEDRVSEDAKQGRRPWYAIGFADVVIVFFTLCILQNAGTRMMDDPGLGWNLRIADLMWENHGFLYREQFCSPTEGRPWVTQAWLGDILLRLAYGWGGLNGIAVFSSLCIALTLRFLYTRMTRDGIPWHAAAFWTFLAALGTSPSWVARPNLFTFPALVLVVDLCERFHRGAIPARKTLWLLPIFVLWPNLHGGFLAGILALGVTYLVECATAVLAFDSVARLEARRRLRWWTGLGVALFAATLVNPYGFGLHLWNLRMIRDPFIQTQSTAEWLPPNFLDQGWFRIEMLVLLFPTLGVLSRQRISSLALALTVVFLHFGLTSSRYSPLWVVVAVPTLASLATRIPWLESLAAKLSARLSPELRAGLEVRPERRSPYLVSFAFAGLMLFASPWMGHLAHHNQELMPSQALDRLLANYQGERIFHGANWGGYLTWHGWGLHPRLKTWIDDRLDVHGPEHTKDYRSLLAAPPNWEERFAQDQVDLLCIPAETRLASEARASVRWRVLLDDNQVAIFRRVLPLSVKTVTPGAGSSQ